MYNKKMLFDDAAKIGAPKADSEKIWKAFGDYIDEVLRMGKGLKVPKFGNFTCVKNSTRDTVPGIKGFTFWCAPSFSRAFGIPSKKVGAALLVPCLEFNWAKLAYKAGVDKDTAQVTLSLLIRTIGQAIAGGQAVRLGFGPVGTMVVLQQRELQFRFAYATGDEKATLSDLSFFGLQAEKPDARAYSDLGSFNAYDDLRAAEAVAEAAAAEEGAEGGGGATTMMETAVVEEAGPAVSEEATPISMVATTTLGLELDNQPGGGLPTTTAPVSVSRQPSGGVGGSRAGSRMASRARKSRGNSGSGSAKPMQDSVSIFPKFTPAEVAMASRTRTNTGVVNANLEQAFTRLQNTLNEKTVQLKRQEADINARQQLTQQLHMERKVREQAKQDELNKSLKKQVDEKRATLKQQRHDDLFSVNPSPERAYPMEQRLNLALEEKLKRTLKSALDEQVTAKETEVAAARESERTREQFLLDCLQKEVNEERTAKLKQKDVIRQALSSDWEKQKALNEQSKAAGGLTKIF